MLVYPIQMGTRIFRADVRVCKDWLSDAYPLHIRVPHFVRAAINHNTSDKRSNYSLDTKALLLHSHYEHDEPIHSAISWYLYGKMDTFVVLYTACSPRNVAFYAHKWKCLRISKDNWTHTCWEHCAPALTPSSLQIPACIVDIHCLELAIDLSMIDRWELHSRRML